MAPCVVGPCGACLQTAAALLALSERCDRLGADVAGALATLAAQLQHASSVTAESLSIYERSTHDVKDAVTNTIVGMHELLAKAETLSASMAPVRALAHQVCVGAGCVHADAGAGVCRHQLKSDLPILEARVAAACRTKTKGAHGHGR